jgi:anaerobic selenocysteine-containing dehydrogenase
VQIGSSYVKHSGRPDSFCTVEIHDPVTLNKFSSVRFTVENGKSKMAELIKTTHPGGCPHDCPDSCSMVFEVAEGKLTGVKGNPDHPRTRDGFCVKLKDDEKRHYHPDRLLYPMRSSGPKGNKQLTRISWNEALDEIVTRWQAIIAEHGPQAIVPYSSTWAIRA